MPIRNNQSAYQRLQEDLDYRLDEMNRMRQVAFDAVNTESKSTTPSNSHSAVRRQQQLRRLGYYKGAIDGDWGRGSKAAHQAALKAGYILNSQGMYVRKPQAQKALHQRALTENQRRQAQLKQLGFYKGSIDDKFGPQSRAAHQAAIDAGYTYKDGQYVAPAAPQTEPVGKELGLIDKIRNTLQKPFPAYRQVMNTLTSTGSGTTQTNKDFTDKYLENLSQLGQVAYRQYVRQNGYPKPGEKFPLNLEPSVYEEINPSGKYANFRDIPGMLNALVGGNRQVEYTDGGMSGTAYIDSNGNVNWIATDNAAWDFDSEDSKSRIKEGAKTLHPGSALRYAMGKAQEHQNESGYKPISQKFDITFPSDTITVNPARYSNVPRYRQKK
jgi:hypothetical protein